MLAALCSSNFQSDLEVLQLQPTLLEVGVLRALSQAACRSFHMFLNQLGVAMATLRIVVISIVDIKLRAKAMVNHTPLMVRYLNNNQLFPCTMGVLQLLVAMEV